MHSLAMAGEHPFEAMARQPRPGLGLLRPGGPTVILRGGKLLSVPGPIQMIASEEKAVLEKQDAVALGVARRRDSQKISPQLPRPLTIQNDLRARLRGEFPSMNDAAAAKMFGEPLGICHVVPVRQEDM